MDPLTVTGAGLAVLGSKEVITKILGPSADYVGGEIKNFVQKCNVNLDVIFLKAKNKLGSKIEEKGSVNSKVLRDILEDGRFCEEELNSDYYAGILASSRVENGRDDRGVFYLSIIKQLSVYQLRLHYIFYHLLKRAGISDLNLGLENVRQNSRCFISFTAFIKLMDLQETENFELILQHSIIGLINKGLIGDFYQYGNLEFMRNYIPEDLPEGGLLLEPTVLGAELLLWADGKGNIPGSNFLLQSTSISDSVINFNQESLKFDYIKK